MMPPSIYIYTISLFLLNFIYEIRLEEQCALDECPEPQPHQENKYSKAANNRKAVFLKNAETAMEQYVPCKKANCSCHMPNLINDLDPFETFGITKAMYDSTLKKGTKYQIISGRLFRQKDCLFPARCSGVEHFILQLANHLPDMELTINTRDWPQLNSAWGHIAAPVFSFSKTNDYWDIMYPAWSFWEGGPAIKLYPKGLGKWYNFRNSLSAAAQKWTWKKKKPVAFFRGSRTSEERDPIVLLSRSRPDLVDAAYTKNQAWKSDADTLHAPPADEVSLEDHCQYRYLFNYRGVAASFRFKHLFLCQSLVFHVGDEWLEFFYPSLKPWVHYIPVSSEATQDDIQHMIEFFKEYNYLAQDIAHMGYKQIHDHLKMADVKCYWDKLLKNYAKLLKYKVVRDTSLIEISPKYQIK